MKKKVVFFRTLWGVDLNFSDFASIRQIITNFKNQGFQGVEVATGFFDYQYKNDFKKLLKELDFGIITQIHTTGYPVTSTSVNEHFEDYKRKVEDSLTWNASVINCHTGRDDASQDEILELFKKISEYEYILKEGVKSKISHETHRQRAMFNPKNTYLIMKNFRNLKYTADISHWSVVNGRLCNEHTDTNWKEIIDILSKNTILIHSRVSSSEQIQVADPFNEENKENRIYYEAIWKKIYTECQTDTLYINPEYGPYPYAILNPVSQKYLVDVDEVVQKSIKHIKNILI